MLAALPLELVLHALSFAELGDVYRYRACSRAASALASELLARVRTAPGWLCTDNLPLILRDCPLVRVWQTELLPGSVRVGHGVADALARRCRYAGFVMSSKTFSLPAIAHLVRHLETPKLHVHDGREMSNALKRGRLRSRMGDSAARTLDLTVDETLCVTAPMKWLKTNTFSHLIELSVTGVLGSAERLVGALPPTLWALRVHHLGERCDDAWLLADLLHHTHLELCTIRGLFSYDRQLCADVCQLVHAAPRVPCVVGLDPFPLEALRTCLQRGSIVDRASSSFFVTEYEEAMGLITRENEWWASSSWS